VAAMPTATAPAPVTVTPVVVMAAPMHLLGLKLCGLIAGGDGRMGVRIALRHAGISERLWRQRRGLCGGRERGGSRRDTEGEFQKIAAFHGVSLSAIEQVMQRECRGRDMNCR